MAESLYISSTNVLKPAISDLSLIVIVHLSSDIVPIAVIEPSFLSDLLSLPILSKLSFTATSYPFIICESTALNIASVCPESIFARPYGNISFLSTTSVPSSTCGIENVILLLSVTTLYLWLLFVVSGL